MTMTESACSTMHQRIEGRMLLPLLLAPFLKCRAGLMLLAGVILTTLSPHLH